MPTHTPTPAFRAFSAVLPLLLAVSASGAVDPTDRCLDAKLQAAAKHARAQLMCRTRAARRASPPDASCLARADTRLVRDFGRADGKGGCLATGATASDVARLGAKLAGRAAGELIPAPSIASRCAAKQLKAGGIRVGKIARAHGRNVRKFNRLRLVADLGHADVRFATHLAAASAEGDCQVASEAVARGLFDSGLDAIYAALGLVRFATTSIPSAAQPDGTPGSPGVDASDYPKLVTQFGGTSFDLNRSTYTPIVGPHLQAEAALEPACDRRAIP